MSRARLVVVATALAATGGAVALAVPRPWQDEPPGSDCAGLESLVSPAGQVHHIEGGVDADYAVLGDAISAGAGLGAGEETWVDQIARHSQARVRVDAAGDTGFVNRGPCGDDAFADRLGPLVGGDWHAVFLQGGTEDVGASPGDVQVAAAAVARTLRRDGQSVWIIGPVDAPAVAGERAVDRALTDAARQARVGYVSMLDLRLTFQSDGVRLDAAGQALFVTRVARQAADGDLAGTEPALSRH